jgi:hypothetical protein
VTGERARIAHRIAPKAVAALPEPEQLAVLFYGLAGEPAAPPTFKELAPRIGLCPGNAAQRMVRRAAAALLGPSAADPTGAELAACGVCGRQIYRPAAGAQHACS